MLINFIINFGENIYTEASSSFGLKLFVSAFGAFIGFIGALSLFYLKIKYDSRKEQKADKNLNIENIKYISLLINGLIEICKNQSKEYLDFGTQLKNNSAIKHKLVLIANNDANRLRQIDPVTFFKSYTKVFEKDINRVKKLKQISYGIDYTYNLFTQAKDVYFDYLNSINKSEYNIKNNIELLYEKTDNVLSIIKNSNSNYSTIQEYNDYFNLQQTFKNCLTIEDFINNYAKPIISLTVNSYDNKIYANELINIAKRASIGLIDFQSLSSDYGDYFLKLPGSFCDIQVELIKRNTEIENINVQ
jgi:hypothetical protein